MRFKGTVSRENFFDMLYGRNYRSEIFRFFPGNKLSTMNIKNTLSVTTRQQINLDPERCSFSINPSSTVHISADINYIWAVECGANLFIFNFAFLAQENVSFWDFYIIFNIRIHFNTGLVTNPSANCVLSCFTSVILRELVFPTWYLLS